MFRNLEVENFGPFLGKHSFDLRTENSSQNCKTLVIIGGKNGTGKTTLLEALKICLYGKFFRGKRLSENAYNKYLRQKFHRYADGVMSTYASVTVEFDYGQLGYTNHYLVKRAWENRLNQIDEKLEVTQNGKHLDDIDEDQWQDFLLELIPPGLSKLFFFDGEQIQNLAKERMDENKYILNSINSLLGLDLVERLQFDLRIYASRKAKAINNQAITRILENEEKKKSLESRLNSILQRQASIHQKIKQIEVEIENQEQRIAMEGGSFASKRELLKNQRKKVEGEIEQAKEEIRDLCATLLPFAYVPSLCMTLKERLIREEKAQQRSAAIAFLDSIIENWSKDPSAANFLNSFPISVENKTEVVREIFNELKCKIESMNSLCEEVIHPLSSIERDEILRWIDISLNQIPPHLTSLSAKLERLVRERQRIEKFLYSAPADDVLHPLLSRLGEFHKQLGMLQEQYRSLEEEGSKIKNELAQVTRELMKNIEEKSRNEKISGRLTLVEKTQRVLEEYLNQLRSEKVNEFRQNFSYCFNLLFNKGGFIQKIDVDPANFSVVLMNDNNMIVPKNTLSAGERQIYAISLLWALARTSGRQLPFIIDTPLGRLDTEYRINVVKKFLPNASHQVIIFSTDTEIDTNYLNVLQPYISKTYRLEYDSNQKATRIEEGYFWKTREEALIHELQ
jgi:DNA sulfur modification protein DndD